MEEMDGFVGNARSTAEARVPRPHRRHLRAGRRYTGGGPARQRAFLLDPYRNDPDHAA